jgi:tetratricopeptide (TPR) repeat protein
MKQIDALHDQAMTLVDEAFLAQRRGDHERASERYREALKLETAAAELLRDDMDLEPSRSVLYRSAASIALRCGQYREAERLIAIALGGTPPPGIAEELRGLRERISSESVPQ